LARKILLADDSVTAQNMGRRILTEAGYEVITVNNGSAALKKVAEAKPDLIVLDVYMPGYGGLEVCQRLREAPETARIPVLLTVGKLEPFKADEARRVRADAFIIKPFEASELLTALTKLEDKIVPQGQPYKPGRFAKAIAAAEESYGLGKEFGNPETGWKDRLSIPPHQAKHSEPEAPSAKAGFRDFGRSEDRKPDLPQETPARESSPAAFSTQAEPSSQRPASDDSPRPQALELVARKEKEEEITAEFPAFGETLVTETAADGASGGEAQAESSSHPSTVADAQSAVTSEQTRSEPGISPYGSADPEAMPTAANADSSARAALPEKTQGSELVDDEVSAALASLAPANGDWDMSAIGVTNGETGKAYPWTNEQVLATMAATAAATPQYSGPRWIAEPALVAEDESTLILEQEMAKAYAAMAAADAARTTGDAWRPQGGTPETDAPGTTTAEISTADTTTAETSSVQSKPAADIPSASAEITPPPTVWPYTSDAVRSQAEEGTSVTAPDVSTEAPAVTNAEEFPAAPAESTSDAVSSSAVSEAEPEAAFAAAASAGASGSPVTSDGNASSEAPASETPVSQSTSPAAEPSERYRESELAAAWANWRQIRESVIGSDLATQVADATAAGFREIRSEPAAPASQESRAETSGSSADESTAIASIVDSVLADLKPKLMEEIARKMGKEPKKK
jgi:CheY-like chemotaxis protein